MHHGLTDCGQSDLSLWGRSLLTDMEALMNRLDMHSDTWRNMALQILLDKPQCYNLTTPHAVKQEKNNIKTLVSSRASSGEKVSRKNSVGSGSSAKKKGSKPSEKAEKDPNAPKRPANPFFQFCQEQRPIVMERLGSESKTGEQDACKIELTKQLASQWKTLTPEDKKVYYDMYEKSKEKYAMEMQIYTNRGKPDDNPS
ncbi:unnamed protein product [Timema podura]|uniref:HMG box domain-containing protein n=1 Tax=Timema podura TaxID=61482 RepID=A0ABN7NVT8_TIMPD|nr:unnamed protein product [Timema podura]